VSGLTSKVGKIERQASDFIIFHIDFTLDFEMERICSAELEAVESVIRYGRIHSIAKSDTRTIVKAAV
jgi:hypothetical protein